MPQEGGPDRRGPDFRAQRQGGHLLGKVWNALATATVVTLLAGFVLFAQPAVYTASAVVAGEQQMLLRLQSAAFIEQLAAVVEQAPEIRQRQRSYPDEPPVATRLVDDFSARSHDQQGLIRLGFTHADPAVAALVVNLAAQTVAQPTAGAGAGPELEALEAAELALQQFRGAHPELVAPDARSAELSRQIQRVEKTVAEQQERIADLSGRLQRIDAGDLEPLAAHSGVTRIRQQLERFLVQQQKLANRYGPQHQKMLDADAEVAAAQLLLAREVAAARDRLVDEQDGLRADLERHRDEARRLEDEGNALREARAQEQMLELQVAQAQRRYASSSVGETEALARAPVPTSPDDQGHITWLAIIFGATALLIFLLQWLRRG